MFNLHFLFNFQVNMSKNSYIDYMYMNALKIGMNFKAFFYVLEGVVYESLEVSLKEKNITPKA